MKHFILLFFATSLLCQGQIIDFPDINFKNALLNHNPVIDTNGDGEIQISEAEAFGGILDVSQKNISDLTGFEYFPHLFGLYASHNNLTQIDFSNFDYKEDYYRLRVDHNNLTELNLIGFSRLQELNCQNNQLTSLNLPTDYTAIDVNCANNQLTNLDLIGSNLQHFRCDNNLLTSLNVGSRIWELYASNNQLTNLNLGPNPGQFLRHLDVSNNHLTSLVVDNKQFTSLNCSNNDLTELHIGNENSDPFNDFELDCSNNKLTDFTIFSNSTTRFQSVNCSSNLFTNLDFSNSNVIVLDSGDNPLLETINWRNGWNYKFDPANADNGFENLPNLNSVCIDTYYPELIDFILTDVEHSVDFYNNETCDALSVNNNNPNELSITPNPAENHIEISTKWPINQIIIYNELGQLVSSKTLTKGIKKTTVDISGLNHGLYFVQITDESGNSTMKKMIKK